MSVCVPQIKKEEEEEKVHDILSKGNIPALPPSAMRDPVIFCPLVNLGNTCYFNAGVQLLVNCAPFVYGLRHSPLRSPALGDRARAMGHTGGPASHELFDAFAQLQHDMEFADLRPTGGAISPLRALDCLAAVHPTFEGRGQQDCPEMVNVIVASIAEEGRQAVDVEALLLSFEEDAASASVPVEAAAQTVGREYLPLSISSVDVDTGCMRGVNGIGEPIDEGNGGGEYGEDGSARKLYNSTSGAYKDEFPAQASVLCEKKPPPIVLSHFFPGSWWNYNVLRLMQTVNKNNEECERRVKARKGEQYNGTFRPPKLLYNSVTDCFVGHMLSEVRCHRCGGTSSIIEQFSSLAIDVSSTNARKRYAQKHPQTQYIKHEMTSAESKNREALPWWNPFKLLGIATRWFFSLFRGLLGSVEYPITLKECLDIHFEPVLLKGNNKYHCASCDMLSEATKRESLLTLPEYLLLQMKRFEYGMCFNTKKKDPVIFPGSWDIGEAHDDVDILQLGDYLHESVTNPTVHPSYSSFSSVSAPRTSCMESTSTTTSNTNTNNNNNNSNNNTSAAGAGRTDVDGALCCAGMQFPIHTYTLESVVNHHGSIRGGHYTNYSRKKTESGDMWIYQSDDDFARVEVNEVMDSEEYLLLYKKQPLQPRSETILTLREKARSLLLLQPTLLASSSSSSSSSKYIRASKRKSKEIIYNDENGNNDSTTVYISRPWLQRMAFMEEPGPIINRISYKTKEESSCKADQKNEEHTSQNGSCKSEGEFLVEWFYVPLHSEEYDAFFRVYGGNTAVTQKEYDKMYWKQQER